MRFEGTKAYVATDDLKIAVNAAITRRELGAGRRARKTPRMNCRMLFLPENPRLFCLLAWRLTLRVHSRPPRNPSWKKTGL